MCPTKIATRETTPHFVLKGVGPHIAKQLARLAIFSIKDLLFHFPTRYQDRTQVQPIRSLLIGQEAVVEGVIQAVSQPSQKRTKLLCELSDGTGKISLRFFHVLSFQSGLLRVGTRLRCYHEVKLGPKGLEMVHPEFQVITDHQPLPIDPHLTPIYPATDGLSQYMLRKLTGNALQRLDRDPQFNELLPESLLQSLSFPRFQEAIQFVHRPNREVSMQQLDEGNTLPQKRLVFEELLAHRMSLLHIKHLFQAQKGIPFLQQGDLIHTFLAQLPFQLTKAQARVSEDIRQDLARMHPMLRLVQGDVGSGKTVVAALAMLGAVQNGYQAAMMAPTELLAEQHYRTFQKWFAPLNLKVVYLSSSIKGRARAAVLASTLNGEAHLVIGTHALFQEEVKFHQLGLIVVDEQHRFGVQQRALFRNKGVQADYYPHQLIMTATPIPRTLAMSFYADLDVSVIDELPPGRTPIMTSVIASSRRQEVIERIRKAVRESRQVYWVCPLIDESEVLNCEAATEMRETLQAILPEVKVGLIHGRMKSSEKEAAMAAFQAGETEVLVATTVIEVGVDVPNASVMVIENAERLGLSQLHQLRGRVGRGPEASHCLLLYQFPLSAIAKERLAIMRESTDGFVIAERDLALRGPGEVLGTRQTGEMNFHVADLLRDSALLPAVQKAAEVIMQDHPAIIQPLMQRWLGDGSEYGKV